MRGLLTAVLLTVFAVSAIAQSNLGICKLDCRNEASVFAHPEPPEYNRAWGGFTVSYPIYGETDFRTDLGLSGRVIITWLDLGQPDRLNFIIYGNIAPPAPGGGVSRFSAVNAAQDGLSLGFQPYWVFGALERESLTLLANAGLKNNTIDGVSIWTYRFGAGFDGSVPVLNFGGTPLNVAGNATYVLAGNQSRFAAFQDEAGSGYFAFDASVIVPFANKLGIALQGDFAEGAAPVYRAGIVVSNSF